MIKLTLLVILTGLFLTASAQAATITVNSLSDTQLNDGDCTLREAIINANADNQSGSVDCAAGAGADTINISVVGTINLPSALPTLTTDMSIVGLGASQTTVRRDSAAATEFRIFAKTGGASTLSGMTIRDGISRGANGATGGSGFGGGISNQGGALTLTNVIVTNNQTIGGNGSNGAGGTAFAGIFNASTLTITGSTISNNTTTGGTGTTNGGQGNGGGILNQSAGTVTITNSVISGNTATGGTSTNTGGLAFGGGMVNNNSTVTITDTVISGNTATGGTGTNNGGSAIGGGIQNFGTTNTTLNNSSVINNSAVGGNGTAYGQGGGIEVDSSTTILTANNSIINGNIASGNVSYGGGLVNFGTVNLNNSTVSNNTATDDTGGLDNIGTMNVTNSTISGNSVTNPNATDAGGGITSFGGTVRLNNITVTDNFAASPNSASGVNSNGNAINVKNTIIAGNRNNQTSADVRGTSFVSNGYNLIGNVGAVTTFNQTGDQTGTSAAPLDPRLAPLGNYGGPTQTHQLLPDSPAIDKGAAATNPITGTAITTDQRGLTRPVDLTTYTNATGGNGSDIGAVELQLVPTAAGTTAGGRVTEANNRGIFRALVTMTDSQGNQRTAYTNQLGFYQFADVAGGQVYVFTAQHRRYQFDQPTQIQFIGEERDGINFTGTPFGIFRNDIWNLPIKKIE